MRPATASASQSGEIGADAILFPGGPGKIKGEPENRVARRARAAGRAQVRMEYPAAGP